jgi:hypothetical protein
MTKKIASQVKRRSAVLPEDRQQMALSKGDALLSDLRSLIQAARQRLATAANFTHTLLCWQVGRGLLRENLQEGRAAYGKQILATASQELTAEFGLPLLRARLHQAIEHAREQEARRLPAPGEQP